MFRQFFVCVTIDPFRIQSMLMIYFCGSPNAAGCLVLGRQVYRLRSFVLCMWWVCETWGRQKWQKRFCVGFITGPHRQWSSGSGSTRRSTPSSTTPTEVEKTPFRSSKAAQALWWLVIRFTALLHRVTSKQHDQQARELISTCKMSHKHNNRVACVNPHLACE